MIVHLMLTVPFYVNTFPLKRGISNLLCQITIMEGVKLNYNKYFKVIPGKYVQKFEGSYNIMREHIIREIVFEPSGNLQGDV